MAGSNRRASNAAISAAAMSVQAPRVSAPTPRTNGSGGGGGGRGFQKHNAAAPQYSRTGTGINGERIDYYYVEAGGRQLELPSTSQTFKGASQSEMLPYLMTGMTRHGVSRKAWTSTELENLQSIKSNGKGARFLIQPKIVGEGSQFNNGASPWVRIHDNDVGHAWKVWRHFANEAQAYIWNGSAPPAHMIYNPNDPVQVQQAMEWARLRDTNLAKEAELRGTAVGQAPLISQQKPQAAATAQSPAAPTPGYPSPTNVAPGAPQAPVAAAPELLAKLDSLTAQIAELSKPKASPFEQSKVVFEVPGFGDLEATVDFVQCDGAMLVIGYDQAAGRNIFTPRPPDGAASIKLSLVHHHKRGKTTYEVQAMAGFRFTLPFIGDGGATFQIFVVLQAHNEPAPEPKPLTSSDADTSSAPAIKTEAPAAEVPPETGLGSTKHERGDIDQPADAE